MIFKSSASKIEKKLQESLKNIIDPKTGDDVIKAGLISNIKINGSKASFIITIDAGDSVVRQSLQPTCKKAAMLVDGIDNVTVVLTSDGEITQPAIPQKARAAWNLSKLEGVNKVIVIASGKGGVGKSTTAVMLARAAAKSGQHVGLLDADIQGPSLPRMMGLKGVEQPKIQYGKIQPIIKDGIACMSMGLLIGDEAAIMRGSMVTKALNQMIRGTAWGTAEKPLDILFIDLPPGTGDVHLSLVQQLPLAANGGGAIIVTTPQEVALEDARKAVQMFHKTDVPIIGVIENMSYFKDPKSGNINRIFGKGGGKSLAKYAKTTLLAEIPLNTDLRAAMDEGEGAVMEEYEEIINFL